MGKSYKLLGSGILSNVDLTIGKFYEQLEGRYNYKYFIDDVGDDRTWEAAVWDETTKIPIEDIYSLY